MMMVVHMLNPLGIQLFGCVARRVGDAFKCVPPLLFPNNN